MTKPFLVLLTLLTAAGSAMAQTNCATPFVQVLRGGDVVTAAGSPLAPSVTLRLQPHAQCPAGQSYQFKDAELTLVRGRRPLLPPLRVNQPEVDLSAWMKEAQPGDRIFVFVPYKSLVVVTPDGKQQPYAQSEWQDPTKPGIGFNWLLVQ